MQIFAILLKATYFLHDYCISLLSVPPILFYVFEIQK